MLAKETLREFKFECPFVLFAPCSVIRENDIIKMVR
jgi:hypothetical protein